MFFSQAAEDDFYWIVIICVIGPVIAIIILVFLLVWFLFGRKQWHRGKKAIIVDDDKNYTDEGEEIRRKSKEFKQGKRQYQDGDIRIDPDVNKLTLRVIQETMAVEKIQTSQTLSCELRQRRCDGDEAERKLEVDTCQYGDGNSVKVRKLF